ncbi:adenosylcobinamide-GDP ribazoletransferase [Streptomyces sp. NPDC057702]|uniref:adenosylcobinamide-GDP ribazoletransferase n=1 Tax=unclassified Streptomyces TaxID=2593676 RepID=UPI003684F043
MDTTPPPSPARPPRADRPGRTGRRASTLAHGLRFAFGTLTVLPVRVTRWDRPTARAGMLCAPLAGLVVGLCAAVPGGLLLLGGGGPLLAAVATVAVPALATRALHLDGLADTADGLGSAKPPAEALRVMKRSDIGPFGVLAMLFVLLAQVAAVRELYADHWAAGALAVAVAGLVARCALTLASRAGVEAARPEGLGAAVAGVVPVRAALAVAALTVAAGAAAGAADGPVGALRGGLAVLVALGVAELLLRHCRRRFGGVTGDVFGALAESAATAALVVLTLG